MGDDFAENDLAHIRNVLNFLEHSAGSARARDIEAVIDLHHERARFWTILAMPRLPVQIELQVIDLLGRMDQLDGSPRSVDAAAESSQRHKRTANTVQLEVIDPRSDDGRRVEVEPRCGRR